MPTAALEQLGDAKVEELDVSGPGDQHVGGFGVAVNEQVRVRERVEDVQYETDARSTLFEWTPVIARLPFPRPRGRCAASAMSPRLARSASSEASQLHSPPAPRARTAGACRPPDRLQFPSGRC